MRNHSFSSLSTAYEHEINHHADDDDSYDLSSSVSSLAKLNRRKPQVSTILKLNLTIVLIISLFMKLTVVSIYNGSLSAFLALKLMTHGLMLFAFLKKHYISLQLLFVLDVILFVIFVLFEFLLFVSNFAIIIIQHKRNKKLGVIDVWLMILIAAIDLLILVMIAIVLENYRRPKERLQQLEAKLVTVAHNGRLLVSQMCKSGSYLLGFVCNSSARGNQSSHSAVNSSNDNGMLQNGIPRIYRDSSNPNQRISCMDTQETSNFSLNEEEYVHYSSLDINEDEVENKFNSFSDFYNFNNRNANQSIDHFNRQNDTSIISVTSSTTNLNHNSPTISTTIQSFNTTNNASSNNASDSFFDTTCVFSSSVTTVSSNNFSNLSNLTNSVTTKGIPSLTTLASSSYSGSLVTPKLLQSSNNHLKEQNKNDLERIDKNLFKTNSNVNLNAISSSSLIKGQANNSILSPTNKDENTYVHMYQSNANGDGEPMDGLLKYTRTTVINNNTETTSNSTSHTVVQMNQKASERSLNCKPVYI